MKLLKSFIVVSIFLHVPIISSAQYTLAVGRVVNPYDTGVIIRIDRYRLEGRKMKAADTLIDSLVSEIKSLYIELSKGDSINLILKSENKMLSQHNAQQHETIQKIAGVFDKTEKVEPDKFFKKVFRSPWFFFAAGMGTAMVLKK